MFARPFAFLVLALLAAGEALAQTTTPAPTSPTAPGPAGTAAPATGIGDYWWVILAVIVVAAAIWYFSRRRGRI
ncbi:LPXTG cell wall anchor domain-containing protein [Enterovirga aerilata]|uniref:LPXTG cell wall anchor domain-containing protein n=1 Tax=Enterovirga aerilata TaxID=2730920 RepID=A0A849IC69_9HYPH|nr:LPXTG cell wall anchor domain-containing protein [Enterovirga sp. DB1703]NNM74871.1 LPXTG cell wall anchor domain-containing protein [Enterovirga sp. DB1703]